MGLQLEGVNNKILKTSGEIEISIPVSIFSHGSHNIESITGVPSLPWNENQQLTRMVINIHFLHSVESGTTTFFLSDPEFTTSPNKITFTTCSAAAPFWTISAASLTYNSAMKGYKFELSGTSATTIIQYIEAVTLYYTDSSYNVFTSGVVTEVINSNDITAYNNVIASNIFTKKGNIEELTIENKNSTLSHLYLGTTHFQNNSAGNGTLTIGGDVSIGGSLTIPSTSRFIINNLDRSLLILDIEMAIWNPDMKVAVTGVMNQIFGSEASGYNRHNFYLFRFYKHKAANDDEVDDYKDVFLHNMEPYSWDSTKDVRFAVMCGSVGYGYSETVIDGRIPYTIWTGLGLYSCNNYSNPGTEHDQGYSNTFFTSTSDIVWIEVYLLPIRIGWQ